MKPPSGSLGGQLGLVGLFDVGQLLMLNRATGCLAVHCGEKKGYLFFKDGRIINAVDDAYTEGERAAYRIFSWRSGAFEFQPEPVDASPTIECSTDGLMLEAARRLDEEGFDSGAPAATGEAARVLEHRAEVEALREAFQEVAGAVGLLDGPRSPSSDVGGLTLAGDRLVYRPGHPPRIRHRKTWHQAREAPLGESEYEKLRLKMLRSCTSTSAIASGATSTRRMTLANGRSIALEFINEGPDEAMWLRPVDLPPPGPERLEGDLAVLDEILDSAQGLILIGGPTLETTRRLLHCLVAMLSDRFSATMLVVSEDDTFRHQEGPGVVVRAQPASARAALRTVQPEFVALDPGACDLTLADLATVPCVIAGVVAVEAAALLPRWLARCGGIDQSRAAALLGDVSIDLVISEHDADDDGPLSVGAWRLSEAGRQRALAGEAFERARGGSSPR